MAWRYATEMTATKRDEWVGRLRAALPFASVAVLVAAIVVALVFVPQWQGDRLPDDLTAADLERAQLLNEFRRTIAQVVAGLLLVVGLYLTWRRVTATEARVAATEESVQVARESRVYPGFPTLKL